MFKQLFNNENMHGQKLTLNVDKEKNYRFNFNCVQVYEKVLSITIFLIQKLVIL